MRLQYSRLRPGPQTGSVSCVSVHATISIRLTFDAPQCAQVSVAITLCGHTDGFTGKDLVSAVASKLPSPLKHLSRKLLQRQTSGPPEPIMRWLVDKHNELRDRSSTTNLVWDWNLAWNAYDYVMYCPDGHSGAQGIGENLAWGHKDFNHAMRDWYDEVMQYSKV